MQITSPLYKTMLFLTAMAWMMTSCSSSESSEDMAPESLIGETVPNFQKAVRYENSKQFTNDLDAFATYALDMQALRMAWWRLLSNDFKDGNAFCATTDDMDGDGGTVCAQKGFAVIDEIVEHADEYQEALDRLQYARILPDPTASQTRGWVADGANFIMNCRNSQVVGRKSVMSVLQKGGWTTDTNKLKQLFDQLPANLRSGYTNYQNYWSDFSKGKLDARANQVFLNLYTYDHLDFGVTAKDMGLTPGANMSKVGAKLCESGLNLTVSALPISTEIGYGKDLYSTFNATAELVTEGNVKGFLQSAANNAINYGPQLFSFYNNGKWNGAWEGFDLFDADEWDAALGLEALSSIVNDALFSDTFKEAFSNGKGERLIPNIVTTTDKNGKKLAMVCMIDQKTGEITVGFSIDKDGNIQMNPKTPGTKEIITVDKNGRHKKKTVIVPEDQETTVEVDMDDESDDVLLEENPADGYLSLDRKKMSFSYRSEQLKTMIISNYLYYSYVTKDDWISCSIPSDLNELTVKVTANEKPEERRGQVTVVATDSKGKVLKSVVLPIVQAAAEVSEYHISASPSSLTFDAKGGKQQSTVTYNGGPFTGIDWDDSLVGWISVDTKDAYDGWYTLVVEASENTTGKERSGFITLYSAYTKEALDNAMNGSVDPDKVLSTKVLVKQAANEAKALRTDVETFSFDLSKFVAIDDEGHEANVIHYDGVNWFFLGSVSSSGFSASGKQFQVTSLGSNGSFKCVGELEYQGTNETKTETLSFTVDNPINGNYGLAKDVAYTMEKKENGQTKYKYELQFTDVPIRYVGTASAKWTGDYAGGVKVKKFEVSWYSINSNGEATLRFHSNQYAVKDDTQFNVYVTFPLSK